MFEPGTIVKFVEPNTFSVVWPCVALTSNSCDRVLMLALSKNIVTWTFHWGNLSVWRSTLIMWPSPTWMKEGGWPTWMNEGGRASVVNATVFELSSTNPAAAKFRIKVSNPFCTLSLVFGNKEDVICRTQIKQTKHTVFKIHPSFWICKSPLGHYQFKRSAKQLGTQHAPLLHTREYVKRSAITSTIANDIGLIVIKALQNPSRVL